jgi:hypothetical protein
MMFWILVSVVIVALVICGVLTIAMLMATKDTNFD